MSDETVESNSRISNLIKELKPWRGCIACVILFLIFASVFIVTAMDVKYPEERYDTYIDVKEDGFEMINFFFASRVDLDMGKPIIMKEAGMKILTDAYAPNGWYYQYLVVYRNGTILESEKEYILFGENRTLLDFDDIELSILQIFSGYGESSEGWTEKLPVLVFTGAASFALLVICFGLWVNADVSPTSYGRRRRGRR